ncbi:D-glycero-beta-D-manno-heptose 1-phosphate adenylyltransferase [bacterium]|nr:D-glycero-beta-D-manno-heptose 1-phosphate adenylyltransferase [bacterium]
MKGLLTRREAAARCYLERLRQGEAVFTNGVFDILHRGHVEYLADARALGHFLIVGLNSDESAKRLKGPSRPINGELDRAAVLLALKSVDAVVLFEEDTPEELIRDIKPTVLVKGGDYEIGQIAGSEFVKSIGGRVLTIPFRSGYSTTSMLKRSGI